MTVPGTAIENGLREPRPQIEQGEWSDDRREIESGDRRFEPEPERLEIDGLPRLLHVGQHMGQQRRPAHPPLPLRGRDGVARVNDVQVVFETPLNRLLERQRAGDRLAGGARLLEAEDGVPGNPEVERLCARRRAPAQRQAQNTGRAHAARRESSHRQSVLRQLRQLFAEAPHADGHQHEREATEAPADSARARRSRCP